MLSDEVLKHVGVKGMKWGVRRNRNRPGGADGVEESKKVPDKRGKLLKTIDSMKREQAWKNIVKEADKMSTKEINMVSKRIGLENDMKRLSKSKVANPKDKDDYLRRANMSDDELSRKVVRLRAKDNLNNKARDASKEQREFGEKITNIGKSLTINYALKKKLGPDDFLSALKNPSDSAKKATGSLEEQIMKKVNENA